MSIQSMGWAVLVMLVMGQGGTAPTRPQDSPLVTMSIGLPDGKTEPVTTHESGLATVALSDGSQIGFRPTIQDARPWTRVVVTVFRMPTKDQPISELGSVEVKTGGSAVQTKTTPAFKVAVPRVSDSNT